MKNFLPTLALAGACLFPGAAPAAVLNAIGINDPYFFQIAFTDLNGNAMLDINEITGFSGLMPVRLSEDADMGALFQVSSATVLHIPALSGRVVEGSHPSYTVGGEPWSDEYDRVSWLFLLSESPLNRRSFFSWGWDYVLVADSLPAVPAPPAAALLAGALGGLALLRRRASR